MIAKAEAGRYQAKPARVFGFDEIVEAHRAMERGLAAGKMVVAVNLAAGGRAGLAALGWLPGLAALGWLPGLAFASLAFASLAFASLAFAGLRPAQTW